jgi:nucleoside-diphosphate-sugar epimerase
MARYLITGIAGFIGSTLARALVEQGHKVRGIDNLSTGTLDNLTEIRSAISFEQMDLQDVAGMKSACEGIDFVLHQGALASVPRSVKDPLTSHESNINGTLNLLIAARDAKVRRIVYAASSSAYGDQPTQPKQEDMLPRPLSPYAVQKLTCEYYIQAFYRAYGLEGVCLRYFNIFGPRQSADNAYAAVIAAFAKSLLAGKHPTIFGDGEQSRDFTFVDNVVHANLLAAKSPKPIAGALINIACGGSITVNELAKQMAQWLKRPDLTPIHAPERAGDVKHSLADLSVAKSILGYSPIVDFAPGLDVTMQWYKSVY